MSDRDSYEIEPEQPGPGSGAKLPPPSKAKIEAPRLLEGFEEDADFSKDPELDRAILGPEKPRPPSDEPQRPDFGQPLFGRAVHWAVAGAVLLIAALVATGLNAPNRTFLRIALAFYNVLLHTGTGVVAVYIAATMVGARVRSPELAAARIFTAVSAFMLVWKLNIDLFGPKYDTVMEELILASLAYLVMVTASFRLWKRTPLLMVVGAHFLLWLVVQVGMALSAEVAAAPKPTPAPPPAAVEPR